MSFPTRTLTVKHPAQVDRFGDEVPDSAPPDTLIEGCMIAPSSGNLDNREATGFASAITVGLTVYAPAGAYVPTPQDDVEVPVYGGRWEVDGLPARWDIHGPPGGVMFALRRVT